MALPLPLPHALFRISPLLLLLSLPLLLPVFKTRLLLLTLPLISF